MATEEEENHPPPLERKKSGLKLSLLPFFAFIGVLVAGTSKCFSPVLRYVPEWRLSVVEYGWPFVFRWGTEHVHFSWTFLFLDLFILISSSAALAFLCERLLSIKYQSQKIKPPL